MRVAKSGIPATPSANPRRGKNGLELGERRLHQGMHGADVRVLQRMLRAAGFRISTDGSFGPQTGRAVRRFQRAHGLSASGVVDSATAHALQVAMAGGA